MRRVAAKKRAYPKPLALLRCIAAILEAPRDRLGRLDVCTGSARDAREEMREYAVAMGIGGCTDLMEQCAKVARAVLIEEGA